MTLCDISVESPLHLAIKFHGYKCDGKVVDSVPVVEALASCKKKLEFKEGVCTSSRIYYLFNSDYVLVD